MRSSQLNLEGNPVTTPYEHLVTSVLDLLRRTDQFYIDATLFMQRFPAVLRDYLDAPANSIHLRLNGDGPPHTWPLFNKPRLDSDDVDSALYFTFAVTISIGQTAVGQTGVTFTPAFAFKPIAKGFEVFILKRKPDGLLDRAERFEILDIQDHSAWHPLFIKCVELWEESCAFDPLSPRRTSIGFDVSSI